MNHPQNINFNQHISHQTSMIPVQTHPHQAMYIGGGPQLQHAPIQQSVVDFPSSHIPSSSSKSSTRHRSTCNNLVFWFIVEEKQSKFKFLYF